MTSISPDGTVIISTRIQATLYCAMDLRKFPFDQQQCKTVLESWMYNGSEVKLHWENKSPVTMGPDQHLTEYVLSNIFTNETMINADLSDLRHGAFAGNYSSLSFTVTLKRQMGFYLIDYFLPSMMIVAISWVSFWLQADQTAPRIMLGTTTMLTFITLASAQGKTLPKVSYIKASEIWFMGCTGFIFGSLVEFAFVNTIWRRKKNVELKKVKLQGRSFNDIDKIMFLTGQRFKYFETNFNAATDEKRDGKFQSKHSPQVSFMFKHQRRGKRQSFEPQIQV